MKRSLLIWAFATLLFIGLTGSAFAQAGSASLGGIVQDASKALIPGVTVTVKNVGTALTLSQVTNESGTYSFPVLQPGTYEVSAELPGFRKSIQKDVALPYAGQVRLNFSLEVGDVNQAVDVTIQRDSILRESSASVGDVLTFEKIQSLPMVGNNVLDLLNTLPGMRLSPVGDQFNTINGLGMNTVNTTRDGLSTVDTRFYPEFWGTRTFSTTTINPDLVGEIRLIVSPVDAELGRGSAQVQISTRSGTNRYTGSASWNIRNSALDANTWTNNHTSFTDPISGVLHNSTPKNWSNLHQYSIAYGGPIKIPGVYDGHSKTFFYTLWDQNIRNTRDSVNVNVLTDTARLGIYRYWEGYNPLGWNPSSTLAAPVFPLQANQASFIAVDQRGNPVRPPAAPTSPTLDPSASNFIPYSGNLTCFSVFGTQRLDGNGNLVPFTAADCPGGVIRTPTGRPAWDQFRPTFDSSGLIQKFLLATPHPNYFGSGDGLNTAQLRWVRGRSGDINALNGVPTTIAGASNVGSSAFVNRKQLNIKIDHNFNTNHKVAASYTLQRDDSADNCANYPGSLCGGTLRRPHVFTVNATSTITPSMVNEARFGLNYTKNYTYAPWYSPVQEVANAARDFMLPAATSIQNPSYQYLALVSSSIGNISTGSGFINTGSAQVYAENPLFNWADTLSWSRGKHSFKFGFDWRLPRTTGNGSAVPDPTVTLGNNNNASSTASPFGVTANFNTPSDPVGHLPGLLNSAPTGATAARTNVTNLLYYLNGSVNNVTQNYWITSSNNQTQGYWDDVSTQSQRLRKQINQEWALFVKDDFKITSNLTLNLGVRWEYYSSPFIEGGFTTTMQDYGYGAFGATRTAQTTLDAFNNDPFSILYRPGNLYLTGYGSSTTNPLSCQTGVQQHPLLPVSTCDPNSLSVIKFVGPDSPNPKITAMPENLYNIGPAIGFAYTLPWFGEGKTTIRGGYQQTFGAAGQNRSAGIGGVEGIIANAPGATTTGTLSTNISNSIYQNILATRAINLGDIASLVPMQPNQLTPGTPVHVYGRSFNPQVYDPNLQTPYTQNITLSVTRQINRKFTVDVRYTGTMGRKQLGSFDINQNNVYSNPELFQALTDTRAGTCTPNAPGYQSYRDKGINPCNINNDPVLFDQLLAGLNLNVGVSGTSGNGTYGAVGTVNSAGIYQSGAQHLRRNATFQNNLSWGNFDSIADSLIGLTPTTQQGRQPAPIDPSTGTALSGIALVGARNGCDRIANGFTLVQQTTAGGAQVANSGTAIPLRCFPEDWMASNPQFGTITYNTNPGHSNYHALQVQLTTRPTAGISTQATWIWAKSLFVPTSGYIDPANRHFNFTTQGINAHSLRMNGTIELPIGPNKLLFGSTTGWVARLIERWQTSFIFNAATGTPTTFTPGISHYYASSGYDIVSPNWTIPKANVEWNGNTGTMYPGNRYVGITDPQCSNPTIVGVADRMGTNLQSVCTISALAARNPDGSVGETLLQYPMPGKVGNLGRGNIYYFGQWSLDMSASKSIQLSESKSFQIRMDATNVLNHPVPNLPTLSAGNLGAITGKGGLPRQFQGQLRISF